MKPTAKDLDGLIARVEQATEGSRELDAAILCAFPELPFAMTPDDRWPGRVTFQHEDGASDSRRAPPYSYSIDAAKALKDRMLPGQAMAMGDMAFTNHPKGPWATVWTLDGSPKWNAEAATAPLAIVLATLRALQSKPEGDVR
jgi:hypothetical protein